MKPGKVRNANGGTGGYLLTEALVYISVVTVVLGAGYLALYRCSDHSVAMRRQAAQISAALHAGERWRTDIRAATGGIQPLPEGAPGAGLSIATAKGVVTYSFHDGGVYRTDHPGQPVRLLENVKTVTMQPAAKSRVATWKWELELATRTKGTVKPSKIRPLFTFIAVAPGESSL